MLHLFRDCPKACAIWSAIGGPITMQRTVTLDWEAWIAANILQKNCKFRNDNWSHMFIFTCWFIWKWRNKYIFDESFQGPHAAVTTIMQYISEWQEATKKTDHSSLSSVCFLSWKKPTFGFHKLNVDGTRSLDGRIGAGGIIRDCNGNWCNGFMRNIGKGEVLHAEAWGLFSGLQIAKEMGINHINVESDSAVLINLIHCSTVKLHPLGTLVTNCLQLMSSFIVCTVNHIHRERNMAADCIAKKSIEQEIGLWKLQTAPEFVAPFILDDMAGLARPRLIKAASAAI
jgi:ribonuclease HI